MQGAEVGEIVVEGSTVFLHCEDKEVMEVARAALEKHFSQPKVEEVQTGSKVEARFLDR